MQDHRPPLEWTDNRVPVSTRFDDPYFSFANGLEETRHVFLNGNDLPARFRDGFHVAELGFGTGLNLLTTWHAWRQAGTNGVLHFTSFEAFPMPLDDMRRALAAFPELSDLADTFLTQMAHEGSVWDMGDLRFTLVVGDARETLPQWSGAADAWFLDGFSPAKNPELWGETLLREVARHTQPDGTAATYSSAGHVRQSLAAAGFDVTRTTGFGRKKHMTRAMLVNRP